MAPNRSSHPVRVKELEFRMLGPLKVRANGTSLRLGGNWVRAVLARLLLNANRVVTLDQLVADLLGETRSSDTGMNTLMNSISRLRELLGPEVLVTRPDGYELRVDWTRTDIHRFERLASAGRERLAAGDPIEAAETLRLALKLWRGEPFEGLGVWAWARPEVARLGELRLAASEDQIDAGLALGNPAILPIIERLVEQYPLRGRLRGQLILALENVGRKTEAVAAFDEARRFLTEVDGGPLHNELRALMLSLPLIDSLGAELALEVDLALLPDADQDAELGITLGGDQSSPTELADPQPDVQLADAAARLFDDWAFRLGRGEWPDPQTYLQLAGDNAEELRLLMDTYIRALPRPAPTHEDIERAQAWLVVARSSRTPRRPRES